VLRSRVRSVGWGKHISDVSSAVFGVCTRPTLVHVPETVPIQTHHNVNGNGKQCGVWETCMWTFRALSRSRRLMGVVDVVRRWLRLYWRVHTPNGSADYM